MLVGLPALQVLVTPLSDPAQVHVRLAGRLRDVHAGLRAVGAEQTRLIGGMHSSEDLPATGYRPQNDRGLISRNGC